MILFRTTVYDLPFFFEGGHAKPLAQQTVTLAYLPLQRPSWFFSDGLWGFSIFSFQGRWCCFGIGMPGKPVKLMLLLLWLWLRCVCCFWCRK